MSESPRVAAAVLAFWWAVLLALGYLVGRIFADASWHWDWSVVQQLRGADGEPLLGAMRVATALGSDRVLDAVFVVALAGLLATRRRREALFLMLASPGSVLLGVILKPAVARVRPTGAHLTRADGFSWPSGHAGNSLALYGALLIIGLSIRPHARPWTRYGAVGITAVLIGIIGVSRIYLGVHYPTDVVASWLLVGSWLVLTRHLLRPPQGDVPPEQHPPATLHARSAGLR